MYVHHYVVISQMDFHGIQEMYVLLTLSNIHNIVICRTCSFRKHRVHLPAGHLSLFSMVLHRAAASRAPALRL